MIAGVRTDALALALSLALLAGCTSQPPVEDVSGHAPVEPSEAAAQDGGPDVSAKNLDVSDATSVVPTEALLRPQAFLEMAQIASDGGWTVVDCRSYAKFTTVEFAWEAVNTPTEQMEIRSREILACEGGILLVAQNNTAADDAWVALERTGYPMDRVRVLDGGAEGWLTAGMPAGTMRFRLPAC